MSCRRLITVVCQLAMFSVIAGPSRAQDAIGEGDNPLVPKPLSDNLNFTARTFGGKQFWCDELVFHRWRVQRNVLTGHCRLLDADDRRRTWGTYDQCRESLDEFAKKLKLAPMDGRVVIMLHGLGRARGSMKNLRDFLENKGKLTAVTVGYPSTRADIEQHAAALGRVIERMPKVKQIDFVAHSMGNIVIRRFLAQQLAADGKRKQKQFGRFVMLCAPNHGALAAQRLGSVEVSRDIGGPAFHQLGEGWPKLKKQLATPRGEFGILSGGRDNDQGFNKLIPGDDDMVISVATTKLAGAADFRVIDAAHTFFMDNEEVRQHTLRFLQHGYFVSDDQRQMLTAKDEPIEP